MALALERLAASGRPSTRWQCPDLTRAVFEQGIIASISEATVWRWLSRDALKPWQHRPWVLPRDDSDLAVSSGRVVDL
jgi:hypothetical protein